MVEDISTSRSQDAPAPGDPRGLRLPPVALWLLVALVALASTLLLYRQALDLPLFFDDMIHAVYATTYSSDGLRFVQAGALEEPGGPSAPSAAVARFSDQVWLSRVQTEVLDGQLVLTLWWYGQQVPDGDATLFVHLYDEAGKLVTQADGHPLLGVLPLRQWRAGDRVRDVRYLALPADMPEGRYTVAVGWYDPATGERLLALDAQDQPVPQDAFPVFTFGCP